MDPFQEVKVTKKEPPEQYLMYKYGLQLYKVFNDMELANHWTALNFTQSLTSRQNKHRAMRSNNFKISGNLLSNPLCILNRKIEL